MKVENGKTENLEDAEEDVEVIFRMPKAQYKKLGLIALNRETSRAQIIRDALDKHLETLSKPEEQKPIIPDRQLSKILRECSAEGGFEIDGEDGFIAKMHEKGFKLKDLTPEQWRKVQEKLEIGYAGYFLKPEPEEFAEKFEVLEPNEEQREWLSTETED